MSQRKLMPLDGSGRRPFLDRLAVWMPVVVNVLTAMLTRLPTGSPLRHRLLLLGFKRAFASVNRSDVEAVRLAYEPDTEVWTHGMAAVGISDCYRGHTDLHAMFAEVDDVFSEWGWTVHDLEDRGDRVAVQIDFASRGRGSGAETEVTGAGATYRLSARGKVSRQDFYVEPDGWRHARDALDESE